MEIGRPGDGVREAAPRGGEFSQVVGNQDMGKERFLQLLTAQLANQDPMNPLEDKDFIAQLAQFSLLEQGVAANQHLDFLGMSMAALVNAQLPSLIGKDIVATGDTVEVTHGDPTSLRYGLDGDATEVSLVVLDSDGEAVRTVTLGGMEAGQHEYEWDGRNDDGSVVPEGTYRIEVHAKKGEETVGTTTRLSGRVTGLDFSSGYAELMVGGVRVLPADIIEVRSEE